MSICKYKLIKDIRHPFGNFDVGTVKTMHEWLNVFGVDWLSVFEEKIYKNSEWFEKSN